MVVYSRAFRYEWGMGNPYTLKSCDVTTFKDHKSPVKPVNNFVTQQLPPLISYFPFPIPTPCFFISD